MAIKKVIQVDVKNKIASLPIPTTIVCGNGNYQVKFNFDDEWQYETVKTARFHSGGENIDIVFTGDTCDIPVLANVTGVYVGVFSADTYTTTPAFILCEKSIRCLGGDPKPPTQSEYQQIVQLCDDARAKAQSVREDADNGKFDGLTPFIGENGNWWIGEEDTGTRADVNEEWVLANEITTTEEVSYFHLTQTDDGTPWDFKEITCTLTLPKATTTARLCIKKSPPFSYDAIFTGVSFNTSKTIYAQIDIRQRNSYKYVVLNSAYDATSWVLARGAVGAAYNTQSINGSNLTSICFCSEANSVFPIGTKVVIYGRVK